MHTVFPVLHESAAARTIEGQAVVVTPRDSMLHTLNPVGSRILELSNGKNSVDSIIDAIVIEYDVGRATAEADVHAYVKELLAKGILVFRKSAG